MHWRIGVDEAGYGPNLGPLVVAATAWAMREPGDLYERLAGAVTRWPDGERIAIADSKRLYKPGAGLRLLECGVGAALGALPSWQTLVDKLTADPPGHRGALPWHAGFAPELPLDASGEEIDAAASQLLAAGRAAGVLPPIVRVRMVFPAEFNRLVDKYSTKGAALSHVTIGLLREVIDKIDGPAHCTLDKHGGRNRYAALLQHHFAEHWIETVTESRATSRYAWGKGDDRIEAEFRTGGEAELPTALASMTAKYLRELAMKAFNAYWQTQVPGIKPTAGYPVDAKRFKAEIAEKQMELKIEDNLLWRNR